MRRNQSSSTPVLFEDIKADYAAAKSSRFRRQRSGLAPTGAGADYHYRSQADYLNLMELARDMRRNDVIVGPAIDRVVNNVIGGGFKLDPQTGDPNLDQDLSAEWLDWANDPEQCDVAGEANLLKLARTTFDASITDGDQIVLGLDRGSLQLVEAHRVRTPSNTSRNVIHGVLVDDYRRRLEYWVTKEDLNPFRALKLVSDVEKYPVRDQDGHRQIFHIYDPKRCTQTRGVTALAAAIDTLGFFEDLNFAKLVQAQHASIFSIIHEFPEGMPTGSPAELGPRTRESLAGGSTRILEGVTPGVRIVGEPGEKITGFSPQIPNPEFFPHVKLILTLIGITLGLPRGLLLLDASETNYSGWRGSKGEAQVGWRWQQKWMVDRFYRPIYLWWLRRRIVDDQKLFRAARREGINLLRHVWTPPAWPYVEPKKDAEADDLRIRRNLSSPSRVVAERGDEWSEVVKEKVRDYGLLIEAAIAQASELNKDHPEAMVDWRELVGFDAKGRAVPTASRSTPAPPAGTGRNGNGSSTGANRLSASVE